MQLQLFAPGTDTVSIVVVKTKGLWGHQRWMCTRCWRGGTHMSGVSKFQLKYALEKHKCRPFYAREGAHMDPGYEIVEYVTIESLKNRW